MAEARYSTLLKKLKKGFYGQGMSKLKAGWIWEDGQYKKVWSGATVVSYYDGETLLGTEDVDEGEDVLHPSFSTTKENYTLYGWTTEPESVTREESLTAQGDTMTVYAIYLPNTYTAYSGGHGRTSFIDTHYVNGVCYYTHSRAGYIVGAGEDDQWKNFSVTMNGYQKCVISAESNEGGYGSDAWAWVDYDDVRITNNTITRTYNANNNHSWHSRCHIGNGQYLAEIAYWLNSVVLSEPIAWE